MLLLLFLLLSTLANSDGEGTNNSLVLKRTQRDLQNYRLSRGPCDENWFYFPPLNSCYWFFSDIKTWMAAEEFCNQLPHSGHLASVSSSIHNFISDVVSAVDESKKWTWIGLNDIGKEGTFTWIDGTSYTYRKWSANEPNHSEDNEDCVQMYCFSDEKVWYDQGCEDAESFVCAYNLHCI
ncbi:C-type lectin BpLec-like [Mobula hypostoma]|uniref:C-type lectin BpLec-like n=1 Tax=Mobula hypostoma TaxID=723540 RepID=UPI002FC3021B